MKNFIFIYSLIEILHSIQAGNILILQGVPAQSYENIMQSFVNVLSTEHNITFLSMMHQNFNNHNNITFMKLLLPEFEYIESYETLFDYALKQDDTAKIAEQTLTGLTPKYIEKVMNDKPIQYLLKEKPKFDVLIIFTSLSEFLFPFASFFDIPLVQISTSYALPWQNEAIGNPNFLSIDDSLVINDDPSTFANRLIKYLKNLKFIYNYNYYLSKINKEIKKYFPLNTPTIQEISRNTSVLFINTLEIMNIPRPNLPSLVEIGGMHCKPAKELPKDIRDFINGAGENGVIYVSFGSTIQSQLPKKLFNEFVNVFRKLPQRIIWKISKNVSGLPKNIKAMTWCPQQDILGHKKTKLFITQGGMLSLQESIYHGVPVLILPLLFDQITNARNAIKLNYGRVLRFTNFSEENLMAEIKEILSKPTYKKTVDEISVLMRDVFTTSTEKIKWWINYIIRHKGNPSNKFRDENLYSWNRWIEIDIMLFIILLLVILYFFCVNILKTVMLYFPHTNIYRKDKSL